MEYQIPDKHQGAGGHSSGPESFDHQTDPGSELDLQDIHPLA